MLAHVTKETARRGNVGIQEWNKEQLRCECIGLGEINTNMLH